MVDTRLAAVRSKKYILPTSNNLNNINSNNNVDNVSVNDASANIVMDNIEIIVPETQTQLVDATQLGSTGSLGDDDPLPEDSLSVGSELEKTPLSGRNSSHEASKKTDTPNKTVLNTSFIPGKIEISKYGYKTPTKKPFELPDELVVSPTCLTPTPDLDAWFLDDNDQFHCLGLIQNLHEFPIKRSVDWLNSNFLQFNQSTLLLIGNLCRF